MHYGVFAVPFRCRYVWSRSVLFRSVSFRFVSFRFSAHLSFCLFSINFISFLKARFFATCVLAETVARTQASENVLMSSWKWGSDDPQAFFEGKFVSPVWFLRFNGCSDNCLAMRMMSAALMRSTHSSTIRTKPVA